MQQQTSTFRRADTAAMDWRRALWLAVLVGAGVALSLGFACAMPFAAFAAASALTLSRRDAVLLGGAVWLANQAVGFTCLGYPLTASTFAWGAAFGAVTVLATFAAQTVAANLAGRGGIVVAVAAFAGAFVAYEGGLFVVAATLLGGAEDYTAAIVSRVLEINAVAFAALLAANRLAIAAGLSAKPVMSSPAAARHA